MLGFQLRGSGGYAMPGCPSCGGTQRRVIAPGYWECQTMNVIGMAPGQQPVTRVCGHRYQEGPGGDRGAERCGCGMYAVGACRVCETAVCGQHGATLDDQFLCGTHWHQRSQENEARRQRETAERERERMIREEEARRDRAAQLPGFPVDGPASSVDIAHSLRALVPERKRTFVLERGRFNRVTKTLEGWVFFKNSSRREGSYGSYEQASGWLIDAEGGLWIWSAPGTGISTLSDDLPGAGQVMGGQEASISDADLSTIRSQLNQWRGIGVRH